MKNILKFLPLLAIATLLSSCLGDNNSSVKVSRDFAYMAKNGNGEVYAALWGGDNITSSALQQDMSKLGKCYFVSYEFKMTDVGEGGLVKTNNLTLLGDPIDRAIFHNNDTPFPIATVDTVGVRDFSFEKYTPYDRFGNNWLFNYSLTVKGKQSYDIEFYFDKTKQFDEPGEGETVGAQLDPADGAIIDIVFLKGTLTKNDVDEKVVSEQKVVDLTDFLRSLPALQEAQVANKYEDDRGNIFYPIKFRYQEEIVKSPTDRQNVVRYIGKWGSKEEYPPFSLAIKKLSQN